MSDKRNHIVTTVLAALLLFSFFIGCLLKPADEISLTERRPLQAFPKITAKSILSGTFMKEFSDYAVDQFPLRESFRKLYATVSTDVLHKSDIGGIYFQEGSAIKMEYPLQEASLKHASDIFQFISKNYLKDSKGNQYLSIIPDKNYFVQGKPGTLTLDYDTLFQTMQKENPQMKYIDIAPLLELSDYYATDSHWRQERIVDVADYLASNMNATISTDYEQKEATQTYRGVYQGQTAKPLQAETMYYLTNEILQDCTVYDHQNNRTISMYDLEKATSRDPYELFLSGPLSYITIENPHASTEKDLIIFRDSYTSSLAPLLATGYRKITLLDIRYLPSKALKSFVDFHDEDVLFLYSASVLNHSETLK